MFALQGGDDVPTNKAAGLDVEGLCADVAPHLATGADFDPSGADAADHDSLHDDVLGRDVGAHQSFLGDENRADVYEITFEGSTDA